MTTILLILLGLGTIAGMLRYEMTANRVKLYKS